MKSEWHLEGMAVSSDRRLRIPISPLPFLVGRGSSCHVVLSSPSVSKSHAELDVRSDRLWVRDLESTNGTFVNGARVGEQELLEGDEVHFGSQEFRVVLFRSGRGFRTHGTTVLPTLSLPSHIASTAQEFQEKLEARRLEVAFQSLVGLEDGTVVGYEVLGRGHLDGKAVGPLELFMLAEKLGRAAELSEAFREVGCREAQQLPGTPLLFFNTHPREVEDAARLLQSLRSLCPDMRDSKRLVLEIHEASVSDVGALRSLQAELGALAIGLAFDDFGTGQPRLVELGEVDADYLKFDLQMIRDIHLASPRRQEMVGSLVSLVKSLDLIPVAEGIEAPGEAETCADLGFELGQGFYFCHPAPASVLAEDDTQTVVLPGGGEAS